MLNIPLVFELADIQRETVDAKCVHVGGTVLVEAVTQASSAVSSIFSIAPLIEPL